MQVMGAARLFACKALWRGLGLESAGRAIADALGSPDEDLQSIAGMFLVQAGARSAPLLREKLRRRENLEMVLPILGDLGLKEMEPDLRRLSDDPDAGVARAARDALRVISARA